MDTSTYTHLCRAGHGQMIGDLAPAGVVLVPTDVNSEIEDGRTHYLDIPAVSSVMWAELAVLTEEEIWTQCLYGRGKKQTALVIDDLLATGMYLPLNSGESIVSWAYEEGLLP